VIILKFSILNVLIHDLTIMKLRLTLKHVFYSF